MIGKLIRGSILISITGVAGRIGRQMYIIFLDLFAFQLQLYEWSLQSKQLVANGQEQLQGVRDSALELLGKEQDNNAIQVEDSMQEKIIAQTKKLRTIAGRIGGVIGLLVRKIMFDIAFGCKKIIHDIKEFIL